MIFFITFFILTSDVCDLCYVLNLTIYQHITSCVLGVSATDARLFAGIGAVLGVDRDDDDTRSTGKARQGQKVSRPKYMSCFLNSMLDEDFVEGSQWVE